MSGDLLLHQGERPAPRKHAINLDAPLPLSQLQAIEKAVELRALGKTWSWPTIADVMRVYHGFDRSPAWWIWKLSGRVESRARGNSFTKDAA